MKGDETEDIMQINTLKWPEESEDRMPLKGDLFPRFGDENISWRGYAWIKYYRTSRNFMIIPKNANYLNEEILVNVMEGTCIDTSKKFIDTI